MTVDEFMNSILLKELLGTSEPRILEEKDNRIFLLNKKSDDLIEKGCIFPIDEAFAYNAINTKVQISENEHLVIMCTIYWNSKNVYVSFNSSGLDQNKQLLNEFPNSVIEKLKQMLKVVQNHGLVIRTCIPGLLPEKEPHVTPVTPGEEDQGHGNR